MSHAGECRYEDAVGQIDSKAAVSKDLEGRGEVGRTGGFHDQQEQTHRYQDLKGIIVFREYPLKELPEKGKPQDDGSGGSD